ncbi:MAG TPA: hypothetical protein VEC56_09835 [Candidatus Krumholzibacteria bacterium]|nr:hypothetical protein [Candidatus Krumholzibacteria bacterium]
MKIVKAGFLGAIVLLAHASAGLAAPVVYDEGVDGDLDQSNPPVFVFDVGVNSWTGTIGPTPTSNTQDSFFANLPTDMTIVHIHWEYSVNNQDISYFDVSGPVEAAPPFGTVLSHKVSRFGDNLTDTGFSLVNPILPITVVGQYKCEVTTGFAVATSTWRIEITVERNVLPTEPSTWGQIKSLYR